MDEDGEGAVSVFSPSLACPAIGAPGEGVAEIAPGIAREAGGCAFFAQGVQQRHGGGDQGSAGRASRFQTWGRTVSALRIRHRAGDVAGYDFDTDVPAPCGEAEHEHDVGRDFIQQGWKAVLLEPMHRQDADFDIQMSEATASRKVPCHPCGWINGRAGKRAEARDEHTRVMEHGWPAQTGLQAGWLEKVLVRVCARSESWNGFPSMGRSRHSGSMAPSV